MLITYDLKNIPPQWDRNCNSWGEWIFRNRYFPQQIPEINKYACHKNEQFFLRHNTPLWYWTIFKSDIHSHATIPQLKTTISSYDLHLAKWCFWHRTNNIWHFHRWRKWPISMLLLWFYFLPWSLSFALSRIVSTHWHPLKPIQQINMTWCQFWGLTSMPSTIMRHNKESL